MSKILIVAATPNEIEPIARELNTFIPLKRKNFVSVKYKEHTVDVLLTGVGMVNTALAMGTFKGNTYDLIINAGVCGSFKEDIVISDVVIVREDCFSELGAQDDNQFLPVSEINLGNEKVITNNLFANSFTQSLKKVRGITVNTVHGNNDSINAIKKRLDPDVESMEGAAFLLACNTFNRTCIQLRAVSNKVEKRNKEHWNLPLAITNLNNVLIQLLDTL